MVDTVQHSFQDLSKLIPIYAPLGRIRLRSSTKVVESAERLIAAILDTYVLPNLTREEIRSRAVERSDPLCEFGLVCRSELEALWNDH